MDKPIFRRKDFFTNRHLCQSLVCGRTHGEARALAAGRKGTLARMNVPWPGADSIMNVPPTIAMRSRMPISPESRFNLDRHGAIASFGGWLMPATALDDPAENHNNGNHQQEVDIAPQGVAAHQPQRPQQNQND